MSSGSLYKQNIFPDGIENAVLLKDLKRDHFSTPLQIPSALDPSAMKHLA